MTDRTREMLAAAGPPLGAAATVSLLEDEHLPLAHQLAALLRQRNGFYAFEAALHVFPTGSEPRTKTIQQWNDAGLWRFSYGGLADGYLFFAEDIFGGQFGIRQDGIFSFDPETGDGALMASSVDEWCAEILDNYPLRTGYPLAHSWQAANRKIRDGERLVPKVPFVLGGDYAAANLMAVESGKGMRYRGELAVQIRDLPDGGTVVFNITD